MTIDHLDEFNKDLKSLSKKYRSLPEDLTVVKLVLETRPEEHPPFSFRIDNLEIKTCIIKVRKIACRSLKGKGVNSGLRLVYALFTDEDRIVLIEIYHKGEKEYEDRARIKKHFE